MFTNNVDHKQNTHRITTLPRFTSLCEIEERITIYHVYAYCIE